MKNILITGANGFIAKNLIANLKLQNDINIFEYDINTSADLLDEYCKSADFIYHLAGVNRPQNESEFMEGNFGFTDKLLDTLKKYNNKSPVMISSSTQALLSNPYGKSKKAGEELMLSYAKENNVNVYIYRLPNVFGKWCKPNYNSAVATFCYNVSRDIEITVNDRNTEMTLVYIDDLISELISLLKKENTNDFFYSPKITHTVKLGEIVDLLYSFKESRNNNFVPNMNDAFTKKLYSTYLSYLREDNFSYPLKMNTDTRGSFTEFIKSNDRGQVSVNISKPNITKGNHWHNTKTEKFLVVSGTGVIRFRKIDSEEIIEYFVSGDKLESIDIPTGYTHNIENLGNCDMVTIMWANETFDSENPDTIYLEV